MHFLLGLNPFVNVRFSALECHIPIGDQYDSDLKYMSSFDVADTRSIKLGDNVDHHSPLTIPS